MKDRPRKSGRTPTSCAIWGSSSSLAFAVKQILPVLPAGYVAGFQIRRKMPQNSGVAGGGRSPAKPVSACANPWKQGKNRELRAKTASIGKAIWQLVPRNQSLVRRIPCAVEQGIKCAEQGRNCPASGTSGSSPGIIRPSADVAVLSLLARPAGVGRRAGVLAVQSPAVSSSSIRGARGAAGRAPDERPTGAVSPHGGRAAREPRLYETFGDLVRRFLSDECGSGGFVQDDHRRAIFRPAEA